MFDHGRYNVMADARNVTDNRFIPGGMFVLAKPGLPIAGSTNALGDSAHLS
jgi:hypothetical protein